MKGIVLAGGTGSRLRPLTRATSKQLLPVFDKPMIYYPISILLLAGVREILVISTPQDGPSFQRLLGDGSAWGVRFVYASQAAPRGIAEALLLAEAFLDGGASFLVLGDNLLYGSGLTGVLQRAASLRQGAHIFGVPVLDPRAYGVIAYDGDRVTDLVEKPAVPPSRYAIPGFYAYDATAPARARALVPSARGELEITDLNRSYLHDGQLEVTRLGRGVAWMDMGTPEALLETASFVEAVQARQGTAIGSPEEVAWRQGWIDDAALFACSATMEGTAYGAYLAALPELPR